MPVRGELHYRADALAPDSLVGRQAHAAQDPDRVARRGIDLSKKLYVGNLAYSCTEDRLREIFEEHGEVASAALVMDRETGRPRGFGFVEFNDDNNARAAIEALNGQNIDGRDLTVNEAKPRENRGGGGGN